MSSDSEAWCFWSQARKSACVLKLFGFPAIRVCRARDLSTEDTEDTEDKHGFTTK